MMENMVSEHSEFIIYICYIYFFHTISQLQINKLFKNIVCHYQRSKSHKPFFH